MLPSQMPNQSALNGVIHVAQPHLSDQTHDPNVNGTGGSPPKQNPQQYQAQGPLTGTNGFNLIPVSNLTAQALANHPPNHNYQNNSGALCFTRVGTDAVLVGCTENTFRSRCNTCCQLTPTR